MKSAQKFWSKDLMYKVTFWLSICAPHVLIIYYELTKINFHYSNINSQQTKHLIKNITRIKYINLLKCPFLYYFQFVLITTKFSKDFV